MASEPARLGEDLPTFSPLRLEQGEAETGDHQDHTFCGIMFNVVVKDEEPLEGVWVQSVGVRGALGRVSVYVCSGGFQGRELMPSAWTRVFGPEMLQPSVGELRDLVWEGQGVLMRAGDTLGVYVHSERPDDAAIVYDNARGGVTFENGVIRILPGLAHLSNVPFSNAFPWAWRSRRAFVGRVRYGVVRLLWRPQVHAVFAPPFKAGVFLVLLCHQRHPLNVLPHAVLLKILNFLDGRAFPAKAFARLVRREQRRRRGSSGGLSSSSRLLALSHLPSSSLVAVSHAVSRGRAFLGMAFLRVYNPAARDREREALVPAPNAEDEREDAVPRVVDGPTCVVQ